MRLLNCKKVTFAGRHTSRHAFICRDILEIKQRRLRIAGVNATALDCFLPPLAILAYIIASIQCVK